MCSTLLQLQHLTLPGSELVSVFMSAVALALNLLSILATVEGRLSCTGIGAGFDFDVKVWFLFEFFLVPGTE